MHFVNFCQTHIQRVAMHVTFQIDKAYFGYLKKFIRTVKENSLDKIIIRTQLTQLPVLKIKPIKCHISLYAGRQPLIYTH